jgi:hypothetical protein
LPAMTSATISFQSMADIARKTSRAPPITDMISGSQQQRSLKRKAYVNWEGQCEFFSRGERKTQKLNLEGASKVTLYQSDYQQHHATTTEDETRHMTAKMLRVSHYQNIRNKKVHGWIASPQRRADTDFIIRWPPESTPSAHYSCKMLV